MAYVHFSPWAGPPRHCWHCTHFAGMLYEGTAAECSAPHAARVRSMPANGCSQFSREAGADDEDGPPAYAAAAVRSPGVRGFIQRSGARAQAVPSPGCEAC